MIGYVVAMPGGQPFDPDITGTECAGDHRTYSRAVTVLEMAAEWSVSTERARQRLRALSPIRLKAKRSGSRLWGLP